jgi:HEAT repeat protein
MPLSPLSAEPEGSANREAVTGREPQLAMGELARGTRRLSLRNLGTMLQMLPPEALSLEAAAELLRSKDFYVRYTAAQLLCRRGDREARHLIGDALVNGDAPTRASAARHLHHFSWFSAEPLFRQALKDPDARVHESAVYALCNLGELNGYHLLLEALPAEDDDILSAAAWGLQQSRDAAAVPVLALVMEATAPEVRVKALEALGASGASSAVPIVRRALADPDADVTYAAGLSLMELAGEEALGEIAGCIAQAGSFRREALLRALFHAGNYLFLELASGKHGPLVMAALGDCLADESAAVRMAAVWPLAWMGGEPALALLSRQYAIDREDQVKAHILNLCASFGQPIAGSLLAEALIADEGLLRQTANRLLQEGIVKAMAGDETMSM